MSVEYVEVVVNRAIVQRNAVDDGVTFRREKSEQADTRRKTFHYHLPDHLAGQLKPGHLVSVPFRHQQLQAVVVALSDHSPVPKTRPVSALLDSQPVVTSNQIEFAQFLADEYLAPLATCLRYFLPPGSNRQPMTVVETIADAPPADGLSPLELALFLYLKQQKKPVPLEDLEANVVDGLVKKKLVRKRATLSKPRVGPKIEQTVELLISPEEFDDVLATLGRRSKQAEILHHIAGLNDPLPALEAVKQVVGCTDSPVNALVEKGLLELIPAQTLLALPPQTGSQVQAPPLTPAQEAIRQLITDAASPVAIDDILAGQSDQQSSLHAIDSLVESNRLIKIEEPSRLTLRVPFADIPELITAMRMVGRYAEVLDLLANEDGPVWIGWVYAQTSASTQTLQKLAEANAIAMDTARQWRDPLAHRAFTLDQPPQLTPEQAKVLEPILATLESPGKPWLLHGVTGSGKTEIYLQAIARILKQERQVIFLVPEVMLATQIVQRVRARFPEKVAVWHSSLSPGERFDTWERVRRGELPIVVGPRSALFAPLQNPGLIIVDEEHEPAYKQDRTPTIHARDAAIAYARLTNSPIIMGSATPDVVSYRKAQRGEYNLLNLPDRILAHKKHIAVQQSMLRQQKTGVPIAETDSSVFTMPMPPVEVVDLREELKAGNRSIFSRSLAQGIEETLAAGQQVILFLNRRGTATFVICRDCGHVLACPRCDTTLTYHSPHAQLACHYCGYRAGGTDACPECGSNRIRYFGLGTERVEATLRREFPQALPIRLDQDTTRKRGSHYTFLQHFVEGRANVMIGTQMVAKGLDLPLVTLVGVISADTALYLPEFRAAERTFQILMQVAGRAGRSPLGGRVVLQTYTPEQPAIIAAAAHNYRSFYNDELRFRYEQGYPPFKRLARLTHTGTGRERAEAAAQEMAARLRLWVDRQGFPAVEIIGPAPTYVQRIGSRFGWQIILRAPDPAKVLGPVPLPLGWKVDIDPVNLL